MIVLPDKDAAAPGTGPAEDAAKATSLRDQLRFNSDLIEAIGNPVYLKDREGRFICVNRAWEQFYGIKREDCIGRTAHQVFPKEIADAHQAHDDALFSGSGNCVYELPVRAGDGKMHDTVHYKTVFSRADGTPAGVIGNVTDVTSLKQTENALRQSEFQMRLISDNAPAQIAYFDADWRCRFGNRAYADWFGWDREDLKGRHLRDIAGAAAFAEIEPYFVRAYAGEQVIYERKHDNRDGSVGHVQVTLAPHFDATSKVVGVYDLVADISQRKLSEAELARSRERLHFALRGSNLSLWDTNLQSGEIFLSEEWAEMLGYPARETVTDAKALMAFVHPDDRERVLKPIRDALDGTASSYQEEHRFMTRSGQWKWVESRGMVVERDADGRALRMTGTAADISTRKQAEASLRASEQQLRLVVDNVPALIAYLDADRRYRFVNKSYAEFFGFAPEEIIGKHGKEVIGEQAYKEYVEYFNKVLSGQPVWYQREVKQKDGAAGHIEVALVPHIADDGSVVGAYVLSRDITKFVEAESRIRHMAQHDALTDLVNRREFENRLRTTLLRSHLRDYALIYLNVDQLKIVNDSCGHAAGDELLSQIAAVLRAGIAQYDLLARLGSDEFGVLVENTAPDHARAVAEKLREAAQALRFAWLDRSFPVSVSIGIVPLSGQSVAELLTAGDAACRIAKNRGRNRIHVYHPTDQEIALRRNQIEWRARILDALQRNRFRLYWQPIAALRPGSSKAGHYEVLLRMLDESGEPIAPMAFIPSAEHFDLMPSIDRWVVSAALGAGSRQVHDPGFILAINLSGQTLGDEYFPAFLRERFAHYGVDPRAICFEITETVAISDFARAGSFIKEFKSAGCRFSLDDFGTGMSSFSYLRNLPVDFLKIDGSFIRNICRDPIDLAMAESINHIGHVMGKQTIAEYVEDEATLVLLRKIGVDYAQGYGIAAPQPMENTIAGAS
jgi:diguanylate cyclase (GGDEF)-like protein/PAS domain S-box-containing protein